jgi:hypothetical protein
VSLSEPHSGAILLRNPPQPPLWKSMPQWLREILVCVGIAARTTAIFAFAVAFGVFVTIKIGEGNPWIAATTAVGTLLLVVLPVRLWWLKRTR